MAQFVRQLVEISHAQWMYRNFTLHHYGKGYLRQWTEQFIRREVDLLANTRPSDLPTKCRYLLELPQRPSTSSSSVHDAYWILAIRAAKTACSREESEYAQSGTRARRREPRFSKNLLDGVADSLRRHLQTDTPRRNANERRRHPPTDHDGSFQHRNNANTP